MGIRQAGRYEVFTQVLVYSLFIYLAYGKYMDLKVIPFTVQETRKRPFEDVFRAAFPSAGSAAFYLTIVHYVALPPVPQDHSHVHSHSNLKPLLLHLPTITGNSWQDESLFCPSMPPSLKTMGWFLQITCILRNDTIENEIASVPWVALSRCGDVPVLGDLTQCIWRA